MCTWAVVSQPAITLTIKIFFQCDLLMRSHHGSPCPTFHFSPPKCLEILRSNIENAKDAKEKQDLQHLEEFINHCLLPKTPSKDSDGKGEANRDEETNTPERGSQTDDRVEQDGEREDPAFDKTEKDRDRAEQADSDRDKEKQSRVRIPELLFEKFLYQFPTLQVSSEK